MNAIKEKVNKIAIFPDKKIVAAKYGEIAEMCELLRNRGFLVTKKKERSSWEHLECQRPAGNGNGDLNFHVLVAANLCEEDSQSITTAALQMVSAGLLVVLVHGSDVEEETIKFLYTAGLLAAMVKTSATGIVAEIDKVIHRGIHLQELRVQSHGDPLSGLNNRRGFQERLEYEHEAARRNNTQIGLLYVDLDGFKHVNDRFGHAAGDEVLKEVGGRLSGVVSAKGCLARPGGDEFALLDVDSSAQSMVLLAKKVIQLLEQKVLLGEDEVLVSCSVGLATSTWPNDSLVGIQKRADVALYQAKMAGRNSWRASEEVEDKVTARKEGVCATKVQLRQELQRAIEHDMGLSLVFQPQLDIHSREIVGVEALTRWNHPVFGSVSPGAFIPIAEQYGLIQPMGEWMIEKLCQHLLSWQGSGIDLKDLTIGFNASPLEIHRHGYAKRLVDILERFDLAPGKVCWEAEITETALVSDSDPIVHQMHMLKEAGLNLALDDFGTGTSSLTHFTQMPLDTLKIDRSFVSRLPDDCKATSIVRSLLTLGESLHIRVVAEGVETALQWAFLRNYSRCQTQGFLFSSGVPAEKCLKLLQAGRVGVDVKFGASVS